MLSKSDGGDSSPETIITSDEFAHRTLPVKNPDTLNDLKITRTEDFSSSPFLNMLNASSTDTVMLALHALAFGPEVAEAVERLRIKPTD
jgi:hypothetical protein